MFSADNVLINYIRSPIIQMDPKSMGVTVADAKDLGLTDGQVVQATVEVRDNRVALLLKGFAIDAPTFKIDAPTFKIDAPDWNEREAKNGDTVQLRASLSTNGWVLSPIASKSNPGPTTSLAAASAASAASPTNGQTTGSNQSVVSSGTSNVLANSGSTGANAYQGTNLAPGSNPAQGISGGPAVNALANAQDIPESANALSPKSLSALENQNLNNLGALSPNVIPNWSTRLNTLIFEPSQLSAVFELLMPGALSSLVSQPQLQNWVQRWNANRLSMASLNPAALKNVVLAQSKTIESQLLGTSDRGFVNNGGAYKSGVNNPSTEALASLGQGGGTLGFDQDPKTMLKSLSSLLDQMQPTTETTKLSHQVKIATNELESSQVQTAQQLMRGDLAFHAVIPFWDADPVDLYFKKFKNGHDDASEHTLSVDIHSKSRVLGEVWLNTSISKSTQVDLVMWAVRPEVAELARTNSTELGYELGVSGLSLNSFQIFNAPKPIEEPLPRPHAVSVLDTRV